MRMHKLNFAGAAIFFFCLKGIGTCTAPGVDVGFTKRDNDCDFLIGLNIFISKIIFMAITILLYT